MDKTKLPLVHNERLWARPWRWAKTAFFIVTMLASLLLVCAPPLLVVLLDLLLPPALLSNFLRAQALARSPASASFAAASLADQARAFRFGSSLVDLPAVSAARSLLILCAYTACGGAAVYRWVAVACSVASLCYVLAKAVAVFGVAAAAGGAATGLALQGKGQLVAVEAMFLMSVALAAAHLAMAYRACCRERRRLLVYRIDVEALGGWNMKAGFGSSPEGLSVQTDRALHSAAGLFRPVPKFGSRSCAYPDLIDTSMYPLTVPSEKIVLV